MAAGLVALVALGATAVPAAAQVPPPLQAAGQPEAMVVASVVGVGPAGDVFLNQRVGSSSSVAGAVLHADGSVSAVAQPLVSSGVVGPDGRYWSPGDGQLRAIAIDGTTTAYDVEEPSGSLLEDVAVGPDARIWYLDAVGDHVGSIGVDGSSPARYALPSATRLAARLAAGPDGRMWVARNDGLLHALTTAGVATTYPKLGAQITVLESFDGSVWAGGSEKLFRVAADGSRTQLPGSYLGLGTAAVANDRLWLWGEDRLTMVDDQERVATIGTAVDYGPPTSGSTAFSMVATPAGDLAGSISGQRWVWTDPEVRATITARGSVVQRDGVSYVRAVLTSSKVGASEPFGVAKLRLTWGTLLPECLCRISRSSIPTRSFNVIGQTTVEVPITVDLVAPVPTNPLSHAGCCQLIASFESSDPAVWSVESPTIDGAVVPTWQVAFLDRMHKALFDRPLDLTGMTYWARRLAQGTSKAAVATSFVDTTTWRRQRVIDAYDRWLRRAPDPSGLDYWTRWLATHTTSELDRQLGGTAAGRDAGGTTNAQRAAHLAAALHVRPSVVPAYQAKLDGGMRWTSLLQEAYWSSSAKEVRLKELGPRTAATPSLASLGAQLTQTRDERGPLVRVLAAL